MVTLKFKRKTTHSVTIGRGGISDKEPTKEVEASFVED
jgi:hypothetical protein